MLYEVITQVQDPSVNHRSHPMAFPGNNFVLQLAPDRGEVGVIAGHPHQQMAVVFRMLLGIPQHVGVDQVDLQGRTRITSYNVCYTKLLRISGVICHCDGAPVVYVSILQHNAQQTKKGLSAPYYQAATGALTHE